MRTFIPQTYEVRLHVRTGIGVVVANDHAFLADKGIAMEEQTIEIKNADVRNALTDPDLPSFYANGFALGHSDADSALVFMRYGRPVAIVNFSSTILKELRNRMDEAVSSLEKGLDAAIPDMSDMRRARGLVSIQDEKGDGDDT